MNQSAMNEHEKHTAFLRALIHHQRPNDCQDLQEKMKEAHQNERAVRRALLAVSVLGLLAGCGVCYSAVLLPQFFENGTHFVTRIFYTTGLGCGICMIGFLGFWAYYRSLLRRLHDECRRFIMGSLQPHAASALATTLTTVQSRDTEVYEIKTPQPPPASRIVRLPKAS